MVYLRTGLSFIASFVSVLIILDCLWRFWGLSLPVLLPVLLSLVASVALVYLLDSVQSESREYIYYFVVALVLVASVITVYSYMSGEGAVFGVFATFPFDDELDVYEDMCEFLSDNPTHDEVKQKALKYISYYAYCKDRPIDFCPTVKSAAQNLTSLYKGDKTVEELKDTWCPSCDKPTENYPSGCKLLLAYDEDSNGKLSDNEMRKVSSDYASGIITRSESDFLGYCWAKGGDINSMCPGCYSPPATPTPTPTPTPEPSYDVKITSLELGDPIYIHYAVSNGGSTTLSGATLTYGISVPGESGSGSTIDLPDISPGKTYSHLINTNRKVGPEGTYYAVIKLYQNGEQLGVDNVSKEYSPNPIVNIQITIIEAIQEALQNFVKSWGISFIYHPI